MKPKIIVFGANGFIGGYLYNYLKEQGYDVIGTYHGKKRKGLIPFDITNFDLNDLNLKDVKYGVICSAMCKIDSCVSNYNAHMVNVVGTEKLIEDLWNKKITPVFLSSAEVYNGKGGEDETYSLNPINVYGQQKKIVDSFIKCNIVNETAGWNEYIIVRPSKVFGLKKGEGLFVDWLEKYRNNEMIHCIWDESISHLYVMDLVKCIEILINKKMFGVHNICNPNEHLSRYEMAVKFFDYMGINADIEKIGWEDLNLLERRSKNVWMDMRSFISETGFKFTSLNEIFEMIKKLKIVK